MQVKVRDEGDTKVVMLDGKLDTNTTPTVEGEVNALLDAGAAKLLINFENVSYTAKRLKREKGDLKVCSLNEMATEVFEVSGFSSILNVYATEQDALGC
jgi:anti-anti-sigma factor